LLCIPGVKLPGREADHTPPFSAEVKNAFSYTSTPQYFFVTWCVTKHKNNFISTFTLTLKELDMRVCAGFIWLRIRAFGGLSQTLQ
jgi:hypothetical protein